MNGIFNKLNGVLFAGMLGGILIAGLGSGIAFAEYMSFEYDDSAISEGVPHEIEEITYEMADGERVCAPASNITVDESVPVGTVVVKVEYDAQTMSVAHNVDMRYGAAWIEVRPVNVLSDIEHFMQNKDVYLQGLKEGKIVEAGGDHYFDISVVVNPADKDRVYIDRESALRAYETENGAQG